jgi:hypothetical protein
MTWRTLRSAACSTKATRGSRCTGLDTFNAYEYPAMSADGTQVVFSRNNEIDALKTDVLCLRF